MTEFTQIISTVGFPIFSFLLCGYALKYVYDKERNSLDNTIEKLTSDLKSSKKFLDDVKEKFNEVKKEIEEKLNYIQSCFNKFHQINMYEITLFETLISTIVFGIII